MADETVTVAEFTALAGIVTRLIDLIAVRNVLPHADLAALFDQAIDHAERTGGLISATVIRELRSTVLSPIGNVEPPLAKA